MKLLLFLALLLIAPPLLVAQATLGSITGKVVDSAGAPLVGTTIRVAETVRGALTMANGNFSIPKVPLGTYTLQVRSVGMEPLDLTVTVRDTLPTAIASPIVLKPKLPTNDFYRDPRPRPRPDKAGTIRSITNEELESARRLPEE